MTIFPLLWMAVPTILGVVLGAGSWLLTRRRPVTLGARLRGTIALASGLLVAWALLGAASVMFPFSIGTALWPLHEWRFLMPLILGIVALAILSLIPPRAPRRDAAAELERRTLWTFTGRGSPALFGALAAASVLVALFAGSLSSPDEEGHYRMLWVDVGSSAFGTSIYGWYYSIPALAALAALLALTTVNLALVSRPPLASDIARDRAVRRHRARAGLWLASGAVALHLAAVFASLAGSSQARMVFGGPDPFGVGTSFAALTPALWGGWAVATTLGTALCVGVFVSALLPSTRLTSRVTS